MKKILVGQFNIGSRVKLVVPWGPNEGKVCGYGVVTAHLYGGIDGDQIKVREADGSEDWHAASWVKTA